MAVSTGSTSGEPRIVFVDDEHDILEVAERLFRNQPYECITFTRAAEALEFLRDNSAHVVVSDLRMPEVDGFQFLKEVAGIVPHATRVVLSAHSDSRSLLEAINTNHAHRFVVKPWDGADFVSVIRQSVELASLKYASQIVHNLKAPIQTIGGAVFLASLLVDHDDPNGAQLQTYLDHIADGARDLQRIVAGILMHTVDDSFFREEPINLNDIVEREIEFFDIDRSFQYRVERRVFLDPELPSIRGNALQFKQVVDVLIKNAIEAMLETERKLLTVTTGLEGRQVFLIVEDSGIGIAEENLGEIFLPFFSSKELGHGTGTGLASARQLVEAYGGSIGVESEPGQGARFTVYLPM